MTAHQRRPAFEWHDVKAEKNVRKHGVTFDEAVTALRRPESANTMKKNEPIIHDDEILPEYDFSGGVRGKHFKAMQAGYTITIHQKDGSTVIQEVEPRKGTVLLEPDVREYFPDSESVNRTLRSLIMLVPMSAKRKRASKKSH